MERVAMNMRIVRVTRVQLDNPAEIAMLGSDQYFQLDTMADIGDRTYEIKTESESIVYHREYPVTCVAVELPSWLINMDANSNRDAASRNEQVWYPRLKSNASGWFYRFWSYKTQETSQSLGENRKQVGPLIVLDHLALGNTTMQSEQQGVGEGTANTATIVIGVLGTLGIWWFVRRSTAKRLF